jgi:1-acyl-sn-glycerol-3-phosphate acyltransferase
MINKLLSEIDKAIHSIAPEIINRIIDPKILEKIERIKIPPKDPFGIDKDVIKLASIITNILYKYWHRVEIFGIDNIPNTGAAIIVPNHGGVLPLDAAYIASSIIIEHEQPRLVRTLVERFLPTVPFFYTFISRVGQTVGTYENAEIILEEGELLQIFPEGAAGATKNYFKYYDLEDFNVGFMELAIKKKVPIIPTGVTGSLEQAPVLFDIKPLAKLLKMPNFPVTPFWPLFGPIGAFPLPSKYRIIFGRPMYFDEYTEEDLDNPELIKQLVDKVKKEVEKMISIGLEMRPAPFL